MPASHNMRPAVASRWVVLGLGNVLNSDEGCGVHALTLLAQTLDPTLEGIELFDGGTLGFNLLPVVEACSHLLILDSVDAGLPPGSLIELQGEEIPLYSRAKLSQHQITFQEVLALARFRNKLPPHLHIVGLQPANLAIGTDLSPVVAATIPHVVARAIQVVQAWRMQSG